MMPGRFQSTTLKPMKANRPHYHPWLMADGDRALFRGRSFHTRQAARQWAARREPDPDRRVVLKCEHERCRPKL